MKRDFLFSLVLTVIILFSVSLLWDKYGYHDENERDSSPEGLAHYSGH